MKKTISLILAALMFSASFVSCANDAGEAESMPAPELSEAETTPETDLVTVLPKWYVNLESHWRIMSNGVMTDDGEHDIKDGICTVCSANFKIQEDYTFINLYDEYGNETYTAMHDPSGDLLVEKRSEYTYDDAGNMLFSKIENDYSCGETEYRVVNGESLRKKQTVANADGSHTDIDYDDYGKELKEVRYNSKGQVEETYNWKYERNAEEKLTYEIVFKNGDIYSEAFYNVAECFLEKKIEYINDKKIETVYDSKSNRISKRIFDFFDNLKEETLFAYDADGITVSRKSHTVYMADGKRLVYEYDENGNMSSKLYDKDGNLITN